MIGAIARAQWRATVNAVRRTQTGRRRFITAAAATLIIGVLLGAPANTRTPNPACSSHNQLSSHPKPPPTKAVVLPCAHNSPQASSFPVLVVWLVSAAGVEVARVSAVVRVEALAVPVG